MRWGAVGGTEWTETTVCQVEGDSLRMPAQAFLRAVAGDTPLRTIGSTAMYFF
jgi:hypothetical protein